MESLGLTFPWFELHAVAKANDLPLLMKYLEHFFHSLLLSRPPNRANPALSPCSLGEHLRTTLGKVSDRLVMKLANLPITINCFVLPAARMPAQCVACAWRQGMGSPVKININELSDP